MKRFIKKRGGQWKPVLTAVLLVLFLIRPPVVLTEIRVDFAQEDYSSGDHLKVLTSYTENIGLNGVQTTYEHPGSARICIWDAAYRRGDYIKRIDPMDYNSENEILIEDLVFYINGFYAGKLDGKELSEMFDTNEQAEAYLTEEGFLGVQIAGEDSQLIPNERFQEFYSDMAKQYAGTGIFYFIPFLAVVIFVAEFYKRRIYRKEDGRMEKIANTVLYAVGVAALVLILTGAFAGSSEINPDESESIYSVQYYMNNWAVPDMRELDLAAFSQFGTARLSELNLYYIFAAQIAKLFTFQNGVRLFGVLMAVGMFYMAFMNIRKNRFLLGALFLTPQLWYLYTYCTSDALDFAVAFLVLYQVANPRSMLHQLSENGIGRKDVWKILLLGFLFSNIFMSKQNYYVIAIYAFAMLTVDLLAAEKERRKKRFVTYLCVAGMALMFLGIRYIPEFMHYGIHKQEVILELQNEIAIPKLRPNSPPEIQSSAFNLYGKGVPFSEFMFGKGLHKTLFRSFVGTYGSLQFPSPDWYMTLMGGLYIALYAGISFMIWKEKGEKIRKIKFLLLHAVGLVSYGLVLYNGYFIDFQAQGRYMLPVLILIAHAMALHPELTKKKWFHILICATAVLSLYSFATVCIPNIKPVH